jgi:glucokinase
MLLGIDVGGTKTVIAIADEAGVLRGRRRFATPLSGDARADLSALAREARALCAEAGASPAKLQAVGVALPGPLDLEAGLLLSPPNLPGWQRLPVRDLLAAELGAPVALENDANAAALAEWRFGAGRGARDMVFLTMSTGVGGGLILGGKLQRGVATSAGEIGHMPIEWEGEPCACGKRGCLEAYVGGHAWSERLARVTPPESRVAALAGGAAHARPEHLLAAAREGDAFALAEVARFDDYLARAIVTLGFVLAPERVVLGTIAVAAGETLCFAPVRAQVRARLWPAVADAMQIVPAELGERGPDYAGISVAWLASHG